jgi:hypothetical protein
MAGNGTPDIRGEQRTELIQDLAEGALTHAQLAEKYGGRHVQAISQFAGRNRGTIAVVRAGLPRIPPDGRAALHSDVLAVVVADRRGMG